MLPELQRVSALSCQLQTRYNGPRLTLMNAPGMATKTPRDFGCPNWQQPSAGQRSADISPPPIWWPPYRNIYAAGLQATSAKPDF